MSPLPVPGEQDRTRLEWSGDSKPALRPAYFSAPAPFGDPPTTKIFDLSPLPAATPRGMLPHTKDVFQKSPAAWEGLAAEDSEKDEGCAVSDARAGLEPKRLEAELVPAAKAAACEGDCANRCCLSSTAAFAARDSSAVKPAPRLRPTWPSRAWIESIFEEKSSGDAAVGLSSAMSVYVQEKRRETDR